MRLFKRSPAPETPPVPLAAGGIMYADDEGELNDGVTYRQPAVVPWYVGRTDAAVNEYLAEGGHNFGRTSAGRERTYRFQFDGNRSVQVDGRVWMPTEDPLEEWDFATRKDVLTNTHTAYHRNPIAKAIVDLTRRFVVGKGHTVTAQNTKVQEVLDAFRANPENFIQGYDRAFIQDVQVDGELFVRVFSENGQTIIAQIPPWHIKRAITAPGFMRRVLSWSLEWSEGGELLHEDVPADDMIHVAINAHGYELRGRPDLFVILPWLRAYNEWLVDRARQNKWRGSLLWLVKVASAVPGTLAKVRAAWRTPPTPGSVAVVPDSVDVSALTNPTGANEASEDGRQIKMMSAVGVGIPEYMLADGQNANLASATAQQLPALWKFTDAQELMAEQVWTPIYTRVIQAAIDAGDLPDEVQITDGEGDPVLGENGQSTTVPTLEAFSVGFHELQADDPKTLTEAIVLSVSAGLSSMETGRDMLGLDNVTELKRIMRERDQQARDVTMGRDTEIPDAEPDEGEDDAGAG